MGKIQEIVNELEGLFPVVNKKGGWLTRSFYTLYGPNTNLDSIVCEDLKIHDKDFLFYYRFGDGTRLALTDTYIYFSVMPGNPPPEGMSTIRQVSHFHATPVTFPVFRANILKMIRVSISLVEISGSMNRYGLFFEDLEFAGVVVVQWAGDGELIYNNIVKLIQTHICNENLFNLAKAKERNLDYDSAIEIYEEIGKNKGAVRVRKLKAEQGAVKVDQTVIHGDYVDDRDTIVKDSVINKSNIGAGGNSKAEELREAKALLDDGIIDDDEFKQMKKEILGK